MGSDTLHGGTIGYDQRNWTVVSQNATTITFSFLDQALEGFPGSVITYATYTVSPNKWTSRLVSIPLDAATPIMLANHVYWNLGAFTNNQSSTVLDNTLYMPYSTRAIQIDSIEVPTGALEAVAGTPLDFTKPKHIGRDILDAHQCGFNCTGYDNAFILHRPRHFDLENTELKVLTISSPETGIEMSIRTNQQSMQMYSCNNMAGTIPVKASQQHIKGQTSYVPKYGCVVFETQQWIDGINHPEWCQEQFQIYSPSTEPAVVWAQYEFGIIGSTTDKMMTQ
jgi:aldose 1-epimerase